MTRPDRRTCCHGPGRADDAKGAVDMPIQVTCPACETVHSAAAEQAGKTIRCTECQERIQIPAAGTGLTKESATVLLFIIGGGTLLLLLLAIGGYFLFIAPITNDNKTWGGNTRGGPEPRKIPELAPP